jgi:hypothetical protein
VQENPDFNFDRTQERHKPTLIESEGLEASRQGIAAYKIVFHRADGIVCKILCGKKSVVTKKITS